MQVLPVGGMYAAVEEEKRRLLEAQRRQEDEENAKKHGGCPSCCNLVKLNINVFLIMRIIKKRTHVCDRFLIKLLQA